MSKYPYSTAASGTETENRHFTRCSSGLAYEDLPLLVVENLHPEVTDSDLGQIFGLSKEAHVPTTSIARDQFAGRSLGYGEVRVCNIRDIEKILQDLQYHRSSSSRNRPIRVLWKNRKHTNHAVFIKNLHDSTTESTLRDIFSQFEAAPSTEIVSKVYKGTRIAYERICCSRQEAAEEAIDKIHGMRIRGQRVYVEHVVESRYRETDTLLIRYIPPSLFTETSMVH